MCNCGGGHTNILKTHPAGIELGIHTGKAISVILKRAPGSYILKTGKITGKNSGAG